MAKDVLQITDIAQLRGLPESSRGASGLRSFVSHAVLHHRLLGEDGCVFLFMALPIAGAMLILYIWSFMLS